MSEVEAAVTSKLSTWQIRHLSVWTDYVEVAPTPAHVPDAEEVVALEDQTQALRFREVKAKVAQDLAAMTQWNAKCQENTKRAHVVGVMHEKGQIQVGRKHFDPTLVIYSHC